jgi:hypothetical protein
MWLRYVLEAERQTRDLPRSFVGFDAFLSDWRGEIERISAQLGITWRTGVDEAAEKIEVFVDRHHQHEKAEAIPSGSESPLLRQVFEALQGCVADPGGGRAVFDEAFEQLNASSLLFQDYVQGLEGKNDTLAGVAAAAGSHVARTEPALAASVVRYEREALAYARRVRDLEHARECREWESAGGDLADRLEDERARAIRAEGELRAAVARSAELDEIAGAAQTALPALEQQLREGADRVGALERELSEAAHRIGGLEQELSEAADRVGALEEELPEAADRLGQVSAPGANRQAVREISPRRALSDRLQRDLDRAVEAIEGALTVAPGP